MPLLRWFPKFLLRHKTIALLCKFGLLQKIKEIPFNKDSKLFIDLNDPEPRNVFLKGLFEPHFFKIAQSLTPPNGTFFDLGANVGFCTFGMLKTRPLVEYHLFEANHHLISLLKKSKDLHEIHDLHIQHGCLSDKNGFSSFQIEKKQSGQSHVSDGNQACKSVTNIVLDDYCKSMGVESVDFAKIDLEGYELPCLKGWKCFLSKGLVKAIYIEIIPENQHRYGLQTHELLEFIESFGYNLYFCKEENWGELPKEERLEIKVDSEHPLTVVPFRSKDYPKSLSTDILACLS